MSESDKNGGGRTRTPPNGNPKDVERRELLRRGALTLGAGWLGLGGVRELLASAEGISARAYVAPPVGRAADPFRIAVVGDSIAWGQALAEQNKFHSRVQAYLAPRLNGRPVEKQVVAHSGAVVAPSADDAKAAAVSGEVPRKYPSITYQATNLVRDPGTVNLVLLTGGINDIGVGGPLSLLLPGVTAEGARAQTLDVFGPTRYVPFLRLVLDKFPNATVVLTNYYRAVSDASDFGIIGGLIELIRLLPGVGSALSSTADDVRRGWDENYRVFDAESTAAMQRAVAAIGSPRLLFVDNGFDRNEAVGAPNRMLWNPGERDELGGIGGVRYQACDAYFPEPRITNLDWHVCVNGSVAHPNVAGAAAYAAKIIAAINPLVASWAAPAAASTVKAMVVSAVVSSSTISSKTVVVTAKDAATGQPLTGTVRINGVTGATGQPITFASCYTTETFEGAMGKPMTRKIPQPCPGTVSVSGYADGSFEA